MTSNSSHRNATFSLSIVVPVFNEEAVLPEFHRRLTVVLDKMAALSEIIYVNDGSQDQTMSLLSELNATDFRCSFVSLSRNFGKEIAVTAGLDFAKGDAIVIIDADLQDPPELIPTLVKRWQDGYDVVYAKRQTRQGETFFKKLTSHWFYRIIRYLTNINIPPDTGDFRLLSRRAADALQKFREQHRFMKGLFAWIGFSSTPVLYDRDPRFAGHTKWNYWKLWNFAIEGITSFTTIPLKLASYLGLLTAITSFLYAIWIIYKTFWYGDPVAGFPSLMVVILFLGGIQLITLGILGEYLGRMFIETKQRPLYLTETYQQADPTLKAEESLTLDHKD